MCDIEIRKWRRKDRSIAEYWPVSSIPQEWLYVPGERRGISYAICLKNIPIGRITLRNISREFIGHCDIGVYLRADMTGKGYGTKALKLFNNYIADNNYGIIAMNALIHRDNIASVKCFTRAGYTYKRTIIHANQVFHIVVRGLWTKEN